MRAELRDAAKSLGFYLIGLAVVAGLYFSTGYVGWTHVAYAALPSAPAEEKIGQTRLAIVVANAREIRAALSKPVPAPERLGPIREKAANNLGGPKMAERHAVKPRKLSPEASEAFASAHSVAGNFAASSTSYAAYDRHGPQ